MSIEETSPENGELTNNPSTSEQPRSEDASAASAAAPALSGATEGTAVASSRGVPMRSSNPFSSAKRPLTNSTEF